MYVVRVSEWRAMRDPPESRRHISDGRTRVTAGRRAQRTRYALSRCLEAKKRQYVL